MSALVISSSLPCLRVGVIGARRRSGNDSTSLQMHGTGIRMAGGRHMQARRYTLLRLLSFLLIASLSQSQSTLSSLRGVIKDPTGAVIANAQISLTSEATAVRQTTTSDGKGQYQFPQVAIGTYRVTVTAAGFADQSKMVELLVNQPATLNYGLSVQRSIEHYYRRKCRADRQYDGRYSRECRK